MFVLISLVWSRKNKKTKTKNIYILLCLSARLASNIFLLFIIIVIIIIIFLNKDLSFTTARMVIFTSPSLTLKKRLLQINPASK